MAVPSDSEFSFSITSAHPPAPPTTTTTTATPEMDVQEGEHVDYVQYTPPPTPDLHCPVNFRSNIFAMHQTPSLQTEKVQTVVQLDSKVRTTAAKGNKFTFPTRFIVGIVGVLGSILLSSTQYNLSVAIVEMVDDSCTPTTSICGDHLAEPYNKINLNRALMPNIDDTSLDKFELEQIMEGEIIVCNGTNGIKLHWNEEKQGFALGAYYYGLVATSLFGGRLSEKFGPKWIIITGLMGAALLNAFTPIIAKKSFSVFMAVR